MFLFHRYLLPVILLFVSGSLFAQSPDSIDSLYNEAVELYQEGVYDQAKSIFTEISDSLCSNSELTEKCIDGKTYLSDIERTNRNFETSETYLEEAGRILKEKLGTPNPLQIEIYLQKVFLYVDMTDFEKADSVVSKALQLARHPTMKGLPRARAFLASAHLEDAIGNFHTSLESYSEAIQSLEDLDRDREVLRFLALVYNNTGILTQMVGNVPEAMNYFQEALEVTKTLYGEKHPEVGMIYNNIGAIYYSLGDYGQAAQFFLRTANIYRENYGENHERVAGGYNNAGVSYLQMDNIKEATENLEKAQRIKESILGEDHIDTAIGYSNLASIYMENKNYKAALENYQKSLSVRKEIYGPEHPDLVNPYIKLGEYYSETNNYSLARDQFSEALRITESRIGSSHPDIWDVLIKIGITFEEQQDYERAFKNYKMAFGMIVDESEIQLGPNFDAGVLSHPLLFIEAAKRIGGLNIKLYESTYDVRRLYQAMGYYSTATRVIDFLQYSYQSEASKLNLLDKNYSIFTNTIQVYYKLYKETGRQSWLNEILRISELSRSRIALETLQEIEAKTFAGVPEETLAQEQSINTRIADYYQQLNAEQEKGFEADKVFISAYRDSLFNSRQKLIKLTDELEQNYPAYYQLKYDHNFADRETIAGLLGNDETLVNYVVGEDQVYALVLDKVNISFHSLGTPDSLASQIKSLREAVSSDNAEKYSEIAYILYQKLLDPIMYAAEAESMIIVPDQMLHYLPFELLLTEKPDHPDFYTLPYFIRETQISYVPSATVLQKLTEQKVSDPRNLLAVAPFNEATLQIGDETDSSRYISDLSPLPLTQYETRKIAEIFNERRSVWDNFSPEKTDILLGRDATKLTIESTAFDEYDYIHFATHAFVNEEDPALSGIVFWGEENEDGMIYVNDIYNMKLNADLVVLGACETGLGTVYKGEGLIGFTRAFIYAGANNLLVSMWRVNDQPTANLMIQFYKYAKEEYSYSESLRMAKLDLIDNPQFASPPHWAAFVLQGR